MSDPSADNDLETGEAIAFGLDTLEQRIILSGDAGVLDTTDDDDTGGTQVDHAPQQTQNIEAEQASPTAQPSVFYLDVDGGSSRELTSDEISISPLQISAGETLSGSGAITQSLTNTGTVAPGQSPGVLTTAAFEQTAQATLALEIGGTEPGAQTPGGLDGYDQLVVTGETKLAGTLSLDFLDDFQPVVGQVYDMMRWGQRSGGFGAYTGLYAGNGIYMRPVYATNGLQLVVTKIPGLDQLNLQDIDGAQEAVDEWLTALANKVSKTEISISGAIDVSGARLSGDWKVAVVPPSQTHSLGAKLLVPAWS